MNYLRHAKEHHVPTEQGRRVIVGGKGYQFQCHQRLYISQTWWCSWHRLCGSWTGQNVNGTWTEREGNLDRKRELILNNRKTYNHERIYFTSVCCGCPS